MSTRGKAVIRSLSALVLSTILGSGALFAQSFQGGIRGLVKDAGGGAVANTKVVLTDQSTNLTLSTLSNEQGEYVFNNVVPATYSLTAEAPGFKKFENKNITLATQQFLTLDVSLQVGNVTESVLVTEEVPTIEVSNASTGQLIDRQKLVDLPNLGRNPFMMSKIAPNVSTVGNPNYNRMQDQSGSSNISIAGGPVRGNNYLIDGIPITDSVNRAVIIPTLETVEEVKVQANTYDAEMGRTGGGVFNTLMKGGANQLHGSAVGYMRQTEWIANTFFGNANRQARQPQPYRNYGGSLGGPVFIPKVYDGRNKTFWNLGIEGYYMTSSYGAQFAVPTAREVTGDFSQSGINIFDPLSGSAANNYVRTQFPGNVIPANRISAIGSAIAKTYPAPNTATTRFGGANYTAPASLFDRALQYTGKFDHQVATWWRASLSYLFYKSNEPGENNFGTISSPNQWLLKRNVNATQFNNFITINPTTTLSVRYGFNRFPNENSVTSLGFSPGQLGFSSAYVSQLQQLQFPIVNMETLQSLGANNRNYNVFYSRNFMVGVAKFIGKHNLKAGYDYRVLRVDGINFDDASGTFGFNDRWTRQNPLASGGGSDLASMLLGLPSSGTVNVGAQLGQFVRYNGFYVHDDYRVSRSLTLNLGLRFETETGIAGRDNAFIIGFDRSVRSPLPTTGSPLTGGLMYAGQNGYGSTTFNPVSLKVAPRLGAAYQLNDKTVLRGGFGMFWAPVPFGLQNTLGYTQQTQLFSTFDEFRTVAPGFDFANPFGTFIRPAGNSAGLLAGVGRSVSAYDNLARSPYVMQYSFDVQRQLPGGFAVLLGYVGSVSRNLSLGIAGRNINQLDPSLLSRGTALATQVTNPFFATGGVGLVGSRTISTGQSLRPYPQFDGVTMLLSDLNSARYDSFVISVKKRMSAGLTLNSNFTYAKSYDASTGGNTNNLLTTQGAYQNVFNLDAEYSPSSFIAPLRWATTVTYELPFGKGKPFMNSNKAMDLAFGGWSFNAVSLLQSGFAMAVTQPNNNSGFGFAGQRPNATGENPATSGSFAERMNNWINRNAFSLAPQYTLGNTARTLMTLQGPGQVNWDMSLFKSFTITEGIKAQFRAEALNAMNTPLFRAPATTFNPANFGTFGRITSQANFPRMYQLGMRITF